MQIRPVVIRLYEDEPKKKPKGMMGLLVLVLIVVVSGIMVL